MDDDANGNVDVVETDGVSAGEKLSTSSEVEAVAGVMF